MHTDDNTPFRAQLWLEITQPANVNFFHRRYLIWTSPFSHQELLNGFEFLNRVFTRERFEAIIEDLQRQSNRIDQIIADLIRNPKNGN